MSPPYIPAHDGLFSNFFCVFFFFYYELIFFSVVNGNSLSFILVLKLFKYFSPTPKGLPNSGHLKFQVGFEL